MSGGKIWTRRLLEDFPKAHLWPNAVRTAFFKKHMNNKERFTVIVFFLANGVSPDMVQGIFFERFNFDKEAWRQIFWVIKNYPQSKWTGWSIAHQRSI